MRSVTGVRLAAMPKKLILLVEDNPDDEFLTRDALRTGGIQHDVVVVRDGAEAVEWIFADSGADSPRSPDLILLDLKLPKMSGFDVLERIRSDARTRVLPVVILTSSSEIQDIQRSYATGANSYVRKPVNFSEFVRAVQALGVYWLTVNEPLQHPAQ
jgi:two-component system response regulator